jgi:pyruvate dehydrogenase E2 component (dihydrolipoamide acetyltransferase)
MHGVTSFAAIINPPQVAILATGQTQTRACVVDGSVQPRMVMTTTLSVDHRVIDGVAAARFLETLGRVLADPTSWVTSA